MVENTDLPIIALMTVIAVGSGILFVYLFRDIVWSSKRIEDLAIHCDTLSSRIDRWQKEIATLGKNVDLLNTRVNRFNDTRTRLELLEGQLMAPVSHPARVKKLEDWARSTTPSLNEIRRYIDIDRLKMNRQLHSYWKHVSALEKRTRTELNNLYQRVKELESCY